MTSRGTAYAAAGAVVLLVGWLAWGRRVPGVGLPLLAIVAASSLLFGAGIRSSPPVHAALVALAGAVAFLAAAIDPGTGYDERNGLCFALGTLFTVLAAIRAYPTRARADRLARAGRGERAAWAAAWTSSFLLVSVVVTFVAVTALALWSLGR